MLAAYTEGILMSETPTETFDRLMAEVAAGIYYVKHGYHQDREDKIKLTSKDD